MPQLPLDSLVTVAPAAAPRTAAAAPLPPTARPRPVRCEAFPVEVLAPAGAALGLRELCHDLQQEITLLQHLVERLGDGHPPAAVERALHAQVGVLLETVREAQGPAAPSAIPLRPVVSDVVQTAQLVHQGRIDLDAPCDGLVQGVTSELRRAFVNLLDNARAATPRGTIRVTIREEDDEVALQVEDDGTGTVDSVGAGIGMTVVGEVARRHGGTVTLAAGALGGLGVTVHLPRLEVSA